jgi:hypothetical protein
MSQPSDLKLAQIEELLRRSDRILFQSKLLCDQSRALCQQGSRLRDRSQQEAAGSYLNILRFFQAGGVDIEWLSFCFELADAREKAIISMEEALQK